jgi:hypothetical protein
VIWNSRGKRQKHPVFRQDNHPQKTYDENVEITIISKEFSGGERDDDYKIID